MEKFFYSKFQDINLNDSFFDSLKNDYCEFEQWFNKKAYTQESAYIQTINDKIEGFLYLKIEKGPINDVNPSIECSKATKIGTMKINPHSTRLGERFIKKSLDFAIKNEAEKIYVTVFEKHQALIKLYLRYGFEIFGSKMTENGIENVLVKDLNNNLKDPFLNYPLINPKSNIYLMSIFPQFHTKLFPDSKLSNENFNIVEDVSYTNSIEKIYICKMKGVTQLKEGDLILIYRTGDGKAPARYRSVVTSICTVRSVCSTKDFSSFDDFKKYCKDYSIFPDSELKRLYDSKDRYYAIKMTYNIALPKRLTRGYLIDYVNVNEDQYWGFLKLTQEQFDKILNDSGINKHYIQG